MEQEISNIVGFLQARGIHDLNVSYGWGCDLDSDDLYQEKPLPLPDLLDFILQSIQSGVFAFGEGNLYISSRDEEAEFVLCHELDVHITFGDEKLALEVASGWAERGYTYYEVE